MKLSYKALCLIACTALLSVGILACAKQPKAEEAEAGPKDIHFWHAFGDEARSGWIQQMADKWNESQSDYKVNPETKGSYRETLNASILAARQNQTPHLVHVFEVGSQLAFDSQIFTPVGSIEDFDFSDYIDSVLNYYTINGQVNSIPFNSSSPVLYYNKDLMREAGLDPESPPQTFTELLSALQLAKTQGLEAAGFGFNLHGWFFEQWVAQQGGLLADNDNGRNGRATQVLLQSSEMQNVFNFIQILNQDGLYKYTGKLEDWSGSDAIFTSGKVMFHMTSTADAGNLARAVEGKFELGTGFMPIPEGAERNGTVIGGGSVWLGKDRPKEEQIAARDFLVFMTNTENMAEWHKLTGYYPVRKSSIDLLRSEGWFESNPLFTTAFDQLLETRANYATAGALLGSFLDTRTIVEEAVQQVLNGGNIAEVLTEADAKANTKLTEYNQNIQ
ncbi:ABC transporter substrate-binding protein [Candidatus Haliotispira prima]|uniref:sn-glycerol-3-phosphate-binding periplasmic protein UgpB n=1 Tax=Candidatus Haliotispira prima TaxID=3034016 RepID=A0ABY8MJM0_9SPIO|nr:ABC transporter substrate-binding protein [Candidatus Haliotispira prima]